MVGTGANLQRSARTAERERIRITVDVAYGTPLEKVKKVMFDIAESSNSICKEPEPRVRFRLFGESGLRFQLLGWIERPELRGRVIDELSTKIYDRFNEEKIEFPFPQRTIHIKKTDL